MTRYIIKKLVIVPLTVLASILLIFIMVNLSPVDPANLILGQSGSEADVQALREELGTEDPILAQYGNYVWRLLHGDMGKSWFTNVSVWEEVSSRLPVTMKLALIVSAISIVIGAVLGILCAVKQYSLIDTGVNFVSMFFSSMPPFWIALMLLLWFSLQLGWFPSYGLGTWKHWILPVVTICIPNITRFTRFTRSAMLDCIRQDYVRTARAKGNKERVVIFRDALRNALIPLITVAGTTIAQMMGGVVVIEQVFSIPGLGMLVISSIQKKDIPMVIGAIIVIAMIFLIITIIMDVLYAVVDPRIKARFSAQGKKMRKKKMPVPAEGQSNG